MRGYHRVLPAWINYLIEVEAIDFNLMAKIEPPVLRGDGLISVKS
jgi:hypothetical protein